MYRLSIVSPRFKLRKYWDTLLLFKDKTRGKNSSKNVLPSWLI
ncbi:hypothetical protein STRDD04_00552 [Streptococcus sp. DD04]|nr:hypothetical protein STRDD04_00552 [Streptococcus sp. DD04]